MQADARQAAHRSGAQCRHPASPTRTRRAGVENTSTSTGSPGSRLPLRRTTPWSWSLPVIRQVAGHDDTGIGNHRYHVSSRSLGRPRAAPLPGTHRGTGRHPGHIDRASPMASDTVILRSDTPRPRDSRSITSRKIFMFRCKKHQVRFRFGVDTEDRRAAKDAIPGVALLSSPQSLERRRRPMRRRRRSCWLSFKAQPVPASRDQPSGVA